MTPTSPGAVQHVHSFGSPGGKHPLRPASMHPGSVALPSHCSLPSRIPFPQAGVPVVEVVDEIEVDVVADGSAATTSSTKSSTSLSTLAASPVVRHGACASAFAKSAEK